MPRTTRKVKKAKKAKGVLKVDSAKKIPMFNSLIKSGSITFVLVYADWCGACTKFKKNIWNPMCQGPARHQRAMIDSEMIKNTSLANADFEYLPSIILVDENGRMQSFKKPDGGNTNAMPTPQSLNEMKKAVNVPVSAIQPLAEEGETMEETLRNTGPSSLTASPALRTDPLTSEMYKPVKNRVATPAGVAYIPTPMVSPPLSDLSAGQGQEKQKGGSLGDVLPSAVLGGLAMLLRGNRKTRSKRSGSGRRKSNKRIRKSKN